MKEKTKRTERQILPSEIARELGRRGGRKVAEKYGRKYFSRIGKIGMASRWGNRTKRTAVR